MIEEFESFAFGIKLMKEALDTLSLSPDEQAAYLAKGGYGDCTDELALEFDDAYQILKGYFGKKHLPNEAENLLEAIDSRLNSMSGEEHSALWTTSALRGAEWKEIRDLAMKACAALRLGGF